MLATVLQLIAAVPESLWGGAFALLVGALTAVVTLVSVSLTNGHNRKVAEQQLIHHSREAAKVRKFELRRSLYLELVGEHQRAIVHLANIPNIDPKVVDLSDGMQGFLVAVARAGFVASDDAGAKLSELSNLFMEAFFKVVLAASPIHDAQSNIDIHDDLLQRANAEVNRIIAAMTNFNESGKSDRALFRTLSDSFAFQQKLVSEQNGLRLSWMDKRAKALEDFNVTLLDALSPVSKQQVETFASLRAELELHGNVDAYRAQLERTRQRVVTAQKSFLDEIGKDRQED